MKKSLAYLPENKQRDLRQLTEIIRREIVGCEMIILFGSYARNKYVDYDQRTEFGVRTYFMSDYDILILTEKRIGNTEHALYSRIRYEFFQNKAKFFHTRPEFINESVGEFNRQIEKSRYFFTEIKEQGVMLSIRGDINRPGGTNWITAKFGIWRRNISTISSRKQIASYI